MTACTAFVLAVVVLGADASPSEFTVPPMPGWTDLSPGAPAENFDRLAPAQMADARSGKYAALGIDFRRPEDGFLPNFNVILSQGVVPVSRTTAEEFGQRFGVSLRAKVRSARVVTSPGVPRLRVECDASPGGVDVRYITHIIPGYTSTAVVTYTLPRGSAARIAPSVDQHASLIVLHRQQRAALAGTEPIEGDPQALLVAAAARGDAFTIQRALAAGADPNGEWMLNTPLAMAAANGQVGAARLLLEHGARIDQRYGLPMRTALHTAALGGQLEMVRFLVESGADVNARNKNGRTALNYCTTPPPPLSKPPNSEEIAKYLTSKGAR